METFGAGLPWYISILQVLTGNYWLISSPRSPFKEIKGHLVVFEDGSMVNLATCQVEQGPSIIKGIQIVPPNSIFHLPPQVLTEQLPDRTVFIGIRPDGTAEIRKLYEEPEKAVETLAHTLRQIGSGA